MVIRIRGVATNNDGGTLWIRLIRLLLLLMGIVFLKNDSYYLSGIFCFFILTIEIDLKKLFLLSMMIGYVRVAFLLSGGGVNIPPSVASFGETCDGGAPRRDSTRFSFTS